MCINGKMIYFHLIDDFFIINFVMKQISHLFSFCLSSGKGGKKRNNRKKRFLFAITIVKRIDLRLHGNDFPFSQTNILETEKLESFVGSINKRMFIEETTEDGEKMDFYDAASRSNNNIKT